MILSADPLATEGPLCAATTGESSRSGADQAVVGRVDHGFGALGSAVRIGGAISGNDDLAGAAVFAAVFAAAIGAEPGVITS